MKNIIVLLSLFAFAVTSFIGCSERIGDFTLISTKNVDIGGKYKKLDERYTGEDSRGDILGIPLGMPNLKTAVDNCIEAGEDLPLIMDTWVVGSDIHVTAQHVQYPHLVATLLGGFHQASRRIELGVAG